MKKSKKTALLIALGAVILGALLIAGTLLAVGYDWERLNTAEIETKTYELTEPFREIQVQTIGSDVRIVPSADGVSRIVSRRDAGLTEEVVIANGTLRFTQQDARKWYESIHIGFYWAEDVGITLELGERDYESLVIRTTSGDIAVPGDFRFGSVQAESTSGDVTLAAGVRQRLTAGSTSGALRVTGITVPELQLAAASGDLYLADCAADTLRLETVSGDITVNSGDFGQVTVKSASGWVIFAESAAKELRVNTTSGEVTLEHSGALTLEITTTSGDVRGDLVLPENCGIHVSAHTTSGSVRVPDDRPGDALCVCAVTTTSGDVRLVLAE